MESDPNGKRKEKNPPLDEKSFSPDKIIRRYNYMGPVWVGKGRRQYGSEVCRGIRSQKPQMKRA